MNELLIIRKDGSRSIANPDGIGIDSNAIDLLMEEHTNLRSDGHHTGQVSSGAVLEFMAHLQLMGELGISSELSDKLKAMGGLSSHFEKWRLSAQKYGLVAVSSLATAIELQDTKEGKQIKGGLGEALAHPKLLLVANYHDEADTKEMTEYERMLMQQGNLLRTESEENDFHAANIGVATGADVLMLCTLAEGFIYKGRKLSSINVEDVDKYLHYIDEARLDDISGIRKGGMRTKLLAAAEFLTQSAARGKQAAQVAIAHSTQDSRRILENNAGTWVIQ